MSFFDVVKGAAKSAGSYAMSQVNELQEHKEKYSELPDEALIRKAKNSSGNRKRACLMLMKERGLHFDE